MVRKRLAAHPESLPRWRRCLRLFECAVGIFVLAMLVYEAATSRWNVFAISLATLAGAAPAFSQTVRTWCGPATALLEALRPLLIPLLVIAAAATYRLALPVQIGAALLLMVLVGLILRPEVKSNGRWWNLLWTDRETIGWSLAALAAAAAVVWYVGRSKAGIGGSSDLLLVAGFVAAFLALVARMVGYATDAPRGAVAGAVGLSIVSGLMELGVFPYADAMSSLYALGSAVVLFLIAAGAAPKRDLGSKDFPRAGLYLSILAGIALVWATGSSLWILHDHPVRSLNLPPGATQKLYAGEPSGPNLILAHRYAPILAFAKSQPWAPTTVDAYVHRASVVRADGTVVKEPNADVDTGKFTCGADGPQSCLRITTDCPSRDEVPDCSMRNHALEVKHDRAIVRSGAIYVRTLRLQDGTGPAAKASRALFDPAPDSLRGFRKLVQYWFFYPYDDWTTKVLGASLTQRHEGDWEVVSVGFGYKNAPLFVAYSAHCGGTWKRWDKGQGNHPVVAVAKGSHGNYADAGGHRPPDFTSCKKLKRGVGELLGYAANVRDVTSADWFWGAETLRTATEDKWPMNFPGTWGGNDRTIFKNYREFKSKLGGGPQSPALQNTWTKPIETIFCDRYWDGPDRCERSDGKS